MMPSRDSLAREDEDPTAKAYSNISEKLESWTSPRLNTLYRRPQYPPDSVEWMEQETEQEAEDDLDSSTPADGQCTPVISNSAKKRKTVVSVPAEALLPPSSLPLDASPAVLRTKTLFSSATSQVHEYRRFHEILLTYTTERRQLSQRWEQAIAGYIIRGDDERREQQERQLELEYLRSLAATCASLSYDSIGDSLMSSKTSNNDDVAWLEANAWSLLVTLRSLGREFLLWDNASMEVQEQQETSNDMQVDEMTTSQHVTPAQLVEELYQSKPSLQRRKSILLWLQQCRRRNSDGVDVSATPRKTMWPDSLRQLSQGAPDVGTNKVTRLDPDAPLLAKCSSNHQNPLYGKDDEHDQELLQKCLNYILAGRMDQAFAVCEQYGQPWRCAAWSGGQWEGVEVDTNARKHRLVGNPNRALWKRTCWTLAGSDSVSSQESAIYALLSNHLETALSNTALRTWESGLFACLDASLQRAEDEHVFSKLPRCDKAEREHLQATMSAVVQCRNEEAILSWLESSPFPELRVNDDPLRDVMASFLVGHSVVLGYVLDHGGNLAASSPPSFLRFLTHLVLYLDSLSSSTAPLPWNETDLEDAKNNLLHSYLNSISSHPDLWRLMTLYASLLPEEMMLEVFPSMLVPIEDNTERAIVGKQMQSLLGSGVDTIVLREVVRLLRDDEQRQMRSITWLCHSRAHWGDALICTNTLLRQWLLSSDDQILKALQFVQEFLPDEVVTEAEMTSSDMDVDMHSSDQGSDPITRLGGARLEFGALICYLDARKAFLKWKDTIDKTMPATTSSTVVADSSSFNSTEKEIARSMEKREFQRQKQQDSRRLVEAADSAREQLMQVLQYDGGWLLLDTDDKALAEDQNEARRVEEINTLHRRYLPHTVFMLHSLCDETGTWMESSLDDAVAVLGNNALSLLDSTDSFTSSPLSPLYWVRHATSLANLVASDEYAIQDAFDETNEHHFADLMTEAEVRELQLMA